MKTRSIIFIGILTLVMSGCLVKSLHPFFKESDVEFKNELLGTWFDEDWPKGLFEENRVKIAHEVITTAESNYTKEYVLTASTNELQKFIVKYGSVKDVYLCDDENNIIFV